MDAQHRPHPKKSAAHHHDAQHLSLIHISDASYGEQGLDLLMVAKYLERIGDHATNVAEWVEYSITGVHPSNN